MKSCTRCSGEEYFEGMCKSCFAGVIERRIRKDLRTGKLIQKNDKLRADPLCEKILRDILGDLPVQYVTEHYDKEVLLWTMEDELEQFLDRLFNGKPLQPLGHTATTIKLFLHVRDKELEAFVRLKGETYTPRQRTKLAALLGDMEQKYPEVKFSLLKSIHELKEALDDKT